MTLQEKDPARDATTAREELAHRSRLSLRRAQTIALLQALEFGRDLAFVPLARGSSFRSNDVGGLTLAEAKRAAELLVQEGLAEFDTASGVPCLVTPEVADLIRTEQVEWEEGWDSPFLRRVSK